jgi:uncharacterized protein (DUF608 family)
MHYKALFILMMATLLGASVAADSGAISDFHGIQYTEQGRPVGMPLGGVGAGSIEISSQGTLMEFGNINNWAARISSIPGCGLYLRYRANGKTTVFPLSAGKVRFEGNFPFAKLTFPDLPVKLTLWCWSPFVLHDIRHSAYPAAIFDAEITNPGKERAEVGLVLAYGTDYSSWLAGIASKPEQIPVIIHSTGSPASGKSIEGIRFATKAELDPTAVEEKVTRAKKDLEDAYLRSYDYTPLNISSACNRSYRNHPFGDDSPHALLNFNDVKPGRIEVYGIPFEVIDDQTAAGKSLVMCGGPTASAKVVIPVNAKADCLFFYGNCAGWANAGTAEYIIRYKDGTNRKIPLRPGYELTDWMGGSAAYLPTRTAGKTAGGGDYRINLFAVPTDGSKEIESVEFTQSGAIAPVVFAVTAGRLSNTPLAEGVVAMRRVDVNRMAGSLETIKLISNTDAEYALTARTTTGGQVFTYAVAKPENLVDVLNGGQMVSDPNASVYAVEQRITIEPGKDAKAGLICSWYAPNHYDLSGHRFGHEYEDWFPNAPAVAEEISQKHDNLLRLTKKHYDIIATSTLPKWFREMVQSNFYLLPTVTWLTKDGIAFTYESANGCALFGTMDVRYYGSFTKFAAFPELDSTVLREFSGIQTPAGFVPHDLGGTSGISDTYSFPREWKPTEPNKDRHSYDGNWVNLPIKYCLEAARNYQWTGDKAFLKEIWPHVKQAMTWVNAQDEDRDGLPETQYGYDGWTMIDKCGYDANQWLVALLAVARLAEDLGEPEYASELRATHVKALAQIEKLLWTGKYFRQSAGVDGSPNLDWVSIIQLAGTWYGDILDIKDGIPDEQVTSAIKTCYDVLGKDVPYGMVDTRHPDTKPINWWICDGVGIGWNYYFMSHAMLRGLDDISLNLADEIWTQFTVKNSRIPWCQEEFYSDVKTGACQYWLLRDMRMGATMVMAYAAAGLKMDVPRATVSVMPAEWVWKENKIVLPVIMPKWLGQVKYVRAADAETYTITNLDKPFALKSLVLRTKFKRSAQVTVNGTTRTCRVAANGAVDVGKVLLGSRPAVVRIAGE